MISTVVQPASTSRFSPVCLKMAGPRPYSMTPVRQRIRQPRHFLAGLRVSADVIKMR